MGESAINLKLKELGTHQIDCKPNSDEQWTDEELLHWVSLLVKRSLNQVDPKKALQDCDDAMNYLTILYTRYNRRI